MLAIPPQSSSPSLQLAHLRPCDLSHCPCREPASLYGHLIRFIYARKTFLTTEPEPAAINSCTQTAVTSRASIGERCLAHSAYLIHSSLLHLTTPRLNFHDVANPECNYDCKTIDFLDQKRIFARKIWMILKIKQMVNKNEYFSLDFNFVNFSFMYFPDNIASTRLQKLFSIAMRICHSED